MAHRHSKIVFATGAVVAIIAAIACPASARASAGVKSSTGGSAGQLALAGSVPATNAAIRNPGKLPVPVVLTYSAEFSDNDTCAAECLEQGYMNVYNWTSPGYTESAGGTLSAKITLTGTEGGVVGGDAPLRETTTFQSSGMYGSESCHGSSTVVTQSTTPGTAEADLVVTEEGTGHEGDLDLDLSGGDEVENVQVSFSGSCGDVGYMTTTQDAASDVFDVDQALGLGGVTGWTFGPSWSAESGETVATNTISGQAPWPQTPGQTDNGTQAVKQTWTVGCPNASTIGERIACIAEIGVYGLPLPGWSGGSIPYSYGAGHGPTPGPSFGITPVSKNVFGLDCSGFTRWVFSLVYGKDVLGPDGVYSQLHHKDVKPATTPSVGNLVFYGDHHVGILVKDGWIAHLPQTGEFGNFQKVTGPGTPEYYTYAGS